jgi:hypothetical protein
MTMQIYFTKDQITPKRFTSPSINRKNIQHLDITPISIINQSSLTTSDTKYYTDSDIFPLEYTVSNIKDHDSNIKDHDSNKDEEDSTGLDIFPLGYTDSNIKDHDSNIIDDDSNIIDEKDNKISWNYPKRYNKQFIQKDLEHNLEHISSSYPPYKRYKRLYSPKKYKNPRKASYVIAIVESEIFVKEGAQQIHDGIFVLPRIYDGTCTGETCAILGFHKKYIKNLLERKNNLYNTIKNSQLLKHIPGIENLGPYNLSALKSMLKYLYFVCDNELILFNIEPKGSSAYEYRYPRANISIPGGGMEFKDEYCWEKCGHREFHEEVGLKLPTEEYKKLIVKQKFTFPNKQSMYFWYKIKKFG